MSHTVAFTVNGPLVASPWQHVNELFLCTNPSTLSNTILETQTLIGKHTHLSRNTTAAVGTYLLSWAVWVVHYPGRPLTPLLLS